jgi:hypothetical protein
VLAAAFHIDEGGLSADSASVVNIGQDALVVVVVVHHDIGILVVALAVVVVHHTGSLVVVFGYYYKTPDYPDGIAVVTFLLQVDSALFVFSMIGQLFEH